MDSENRPEKAVNPSLNRFMINKFGVVPLSQKSWKMSIVFNLGGNAGILNSRPLFIAGMGVFCLGKQKL